MTTTDPMPIDLDSLPKRGDVVQYDGRFYLINEIDFAVRNPDPPTATGWVRAPEARGALRCGFRAIEIDPTAVAVGAETADHETGDRA